MNHPTYKDSGVEWLGEIPVHWESKVLKRSFRVVNGSTPKSGEPENWNGDIPWVTPDDLGKLSGRVLDEPARYITRKGYESCGTQMVGAGSLILSTRAPIGHLAISGTPVCTNQGCRSLVSLYTCSETYFYFQLLATRPVLEAAGRGSTFRELAREDLESVLLSVPPLDEQRAIAAFLDRETAKIDGLVARKERLIELLQEKRTALITRAVTRGLDPNVTMKDSGVEWLGEIPAHWKVTPLRFACRSIETGGTPSIDYLDDLGKSHVNWFTPGDFGGDLVLRDSVRKLAPRAVSLGQARLFPADSVFVVGIGATLGKVGLIERPASANQQVNVIIPRDGVESYFLAHFLLILGDVMATMANSATLPILNQRQMGALHVPIPPVPEQDEIIAFVRKETAVIDVLIAKVCQAIDLLKEFRTALISAAVTGKIDVREEAA